MSRVVGAKTNRRKLQFQTYSMKGSIKVDKKSCFRQNSIWELKYATKLWELKYLKILKELKNQNPGTKFRDLKSATNLKLVASLVTKNCAEF